MQFSYFKFVFLILFVFSEIVFATKPYIDTYEVVVKAGDVFQGNHYPPGSVVTVINANKAVAYVVLSADFTMNGNLLKKGTKLGTDQNGSLVEITPVAGQKINDIVFEDSEVSYIRFSSAGKIEQLHLNAAKIIQKIKFVADSEVVFYPNGQVFSGSVAGEQTIKGLAVLERSEIKFYPTGQLKSAKLAKDSEISADIEPTAPTPEKIWVKGELGSTSPSDIEFWPDGRVKRAILAKPIKIQGYDCAAGPVTFFEKGHVKTLILAANRKVMLNPYAGQKPAEKNARAGDAFTFNEAGDVIGWASGAGAGADSRAGAGK